MDFFKDRTMKELKAKYAKCVGDMKALMEAAGDEAMSADDQAKFDALSEQETVLTNQIANCERMEKAQAEADRQAKTNGVAMARQIDGAGVVNTDPAKEAAASASAASAAQPIIIPARAYRFAGNMRAFTGKNAVEDAYSAGQWYLAISGNNSSSKWCSEHGMGLAISNGQIEGEDTKGGYMVPIQIETSIIRLVESFGMFRQKARNQPMLSETLDRNRRTGGVTATFAGETEAVDHSTMTWDQVSLVAKKLKATAIISNELNADTVISIGDQITEEIALAFATKEDNCGFNGTGTAAFGKIIGIRTKLITINGVDDGGGLVLGTDETWGGLVLADFTKVTGQTLNLANAIEEWYCSKPFFAQVMMNIKYAGGGNTVSDIEGGNRKSFLGYPVNLSNSFPKTTAVSQVCAIFGDLNLSSTFGDRMGMTLTMSEHATVDGISMFDTDQIAVKGVERFDINNQSLGTASEGGPVVGLITAAS
jgi:HK97 family phage major capsid protein